MYTITLQASSAAELSQGLQDLAHLLSAKTQAVVVGTIAVAQEKEVVAQGGTVKATKKAKLEVVKAAEPEVEAPTVEASESSITFATAKDAMLGLAQKKGREATLQVLGQFQDIKKQPCARVTSVQEKDYEAFMEAVEEAMKDAE